MKEMDKSTVKLIGKTLEAVRPFDRMMGHIQRLRLESNLGAEMIDAGHTEAEADAVNDIINVCVLLDCGIGEMKALLRAVGFELEE